MELVQRLPDWDFVGGSTQSRTFQLTNLDGIEYNVEQGMAHFAMQYYVNDGEPIIQKQSAITASEDGNHCLAVVTLDPEETRDMEGYFIYQITVKDSAGHVAIPSHGRMRITRNITSHEMV